MAYCGSRTRRSFTCYGWTLATERSRHQTLSSKPCCIARIGHRSRLRNWSLTACHDDVRFTNQPSDFKGYYMASIPSFRTNTLHHYAEHLGTLLMPWWVSVRSQPKDGSFALQCPTSGMKKNKMDANRNTAKRTTCELIQLLHQDYFNVSIFKEMINSSGEFHDITQEVIEGCN